MLNALKGKVPVICYSHGVEFGILCRRDGCYVVVVQRGCHYLSPRFSSIGRFPGPTLAAASYLYEFYYDVFSDGGGQYTNEVERMHDRFGPVVRVTPDEVHVRDGEWSSVLYAGPGKTRIKDPRLSEVAGTGNGCFGTSEPQIHRRRRAPVNAFYSRNSISRMQEKFGIKRITYAKYSGATYKPNQ